MNKSPAPVSAEKRRARPDFSSLRHLLPFIGQDWGRVAMALVALAAASVLTLLVPLAVRRMVDFGFSAENRGLVDAYFGMIVLLTLGLALASAIRYYCVMTIGERVVARIRTAVFARVMALDGAFFDSARSGEIVSRLSADTTQLKSTFGASASVALRNLILLIGAVVMMVVTSPQLSAYVMLAIPAIVLPLVAAGKGVRGKSQFAQDTLAEAMSFATERVGAARIVQGFGGEKAATKRFGDAVDTAYAAASKATGARAVLTAVIIFLVFASITFVLWTGAKSVITGEISPGRLSQFVFYAVFAASALSQLSDVFGELSQAAGASQRLSELLHTEPLVREIAEPRAPAHPARGALAFEGVVFAYPGAPERRVLGPIDLHVKGGERVAIVGPSGAGKTSLFQLLMRFYDPQQGRIRIDGIAIDEMALADLRALVASVPQDPVIFADTIMGNIRLARPDASDEDVRLAAAKASVAAFADRLPDGLATMIGERGVTLSGGERQRIAIARAILRDAPILLLDEATSALDAENEHAVQKALDAAMKGRTALVIAHRLSTIRDADRIVVLDQGRLVEEGTHEMLAGAEGLYARLASLQFGVAN
ncbi:MAG: ATP-binding cassette domain-containing protein [Proteobacteria bacterium]|nr:ATP-binding cassette domain-containing protein [Pseudomonadota bacterium]